MARIVQQEENNDLEEVSQDQEAPETEAQQQEENEEDKGSTFELCYKCVNIPGLQIQYGETPDRSLQPNLMAFTPLKFWNESKGETYEIGYLCTDETDVQEILSEDPNVEMISKKEYKEAFSQAKKGR